MSFKAVLFDLDDTLYAYAPCNSQGLRAAYNLLAHEFDMPFEQFLAVHEEVRQDLAKHLKQQAARHNRILFFKRILERQIGRADPKLVVQLYQCYWTAFIQHMKPNGNANQVLAALSNFYQMALVSNHTTIPQLKKVHRLGFNQFFPIVITSEEAGVEKPDSRIFEMALQQLKVSAKEAVFVGDSPDGDIAGAQAVGLTTIHTVEYLGFTSGAPCADHTIHRLEDLLELLLPADRSRPA